MWLCCAVYWTRVYSCDWRQWRHTETQRHVPCAQQPVPCNELVWVVAVKYVLYMVFKFYQLRIDLHWTFSVPVGRRSQFSWTLSGWFLLLVGWRSLCGILDPIIVFAGPLEDINLPEFLATECDGGGKDRTIELWTLIIVESVFARPLWSAVLSDGQIWSAILKATIVTES